MSIAPEEPSGYKKYMPGGDKPMAPDARRRVLTIAAIIFVVGIFIIPSLFTRKDVKTISYSSLLRDAKHQKVDTAVINTTSGVITGQLTAAVLIDRFGLLGIAKQPINAGRIVGLVLLVAGVVLVVRR